MAQITLKGNPIETSGELPSSGKAAPDFHLVKPDLSETHLGHYSGKRLILNIFPSVDTPVCATSIRRFNEEANQLKNTAILCVSADLPFAAARFCGAENLNNVETGSSFRSSFGKDYGAEITSGPMAGLLSRAVVVIDESGTVVHTELVGEIAHEPNYQAALEALS